MVKEKTPHKYKILYVVSTLRRGGPTNQLFGLLKNLDRSIFYPIILTLSRVEDLEIKDKFINIGIEIESLGFSKLESMFKVKKNCLIWLTN